MAERGSKQVIKPDWDQSKKRFEAWWHGEAHDRVLLQVVANSDDRDSLPPFHYPEDPLERWLSVDFRLRELEYHRSRVYLGGDSFPYLDTTIGPGTMSLYLGSKPGFHHETVWYNPCVEDITTADVPVYDHENRYWNFTQELTRKGLEHFDGEALVSFPDLIEGLDTVSSLVGNDELLYYLIDAPEHVHRFMRAVTDLYFEYYDRLYNMIKDENGGSCFSAFQTWAPGRIAKVQCDFSAMISAAMFEEFEVPYLAEQCSRLDYSVYHLDGPVCIQHLDLLLGIKDLNAIQWTPGAGQPWATDPSYIPMYKKIRAAGKSVMVRGGTPDQARVLVEELGPEGLDISIGIETRQEADEVVKQSFGWKKK